MPKNLSLHIWRFINSNHLHSEQSLSHKQQPFGSERTNNCKQQTGETLNSYHYLPLIKFNFHSNLLLHLTHGSAGGLRRQTQAISFPPDGGIWVFWYRYRCVSSDLSSYKYFSFLGLMVIFHRRNIVKSGVRMIFIYKMWVMWVLSWLLVFFKCDVLYLCAQARSLVRGYQVAAGRVMEKRRVISSKEPSNWGLRFLWLNCFIDYAVRKKMQVSEGYDYLLLHKCGWNNNE